MSLKEIFNAAKLPVILGIALLVLSNIIQNVPFGVILFWIAELLIFLYSGYSTVKKYNLSLLNAVVVGSIVGIAETATQVVMDIPKILEAVGKSGLFLTLFGMVISLPIMLILYVSLGLILGLTGGFIAQKTKPR